MSRAAAGLGGWCDPAFRPVAEQLAAELAEGGLGGALAVHVVDGGVARPVVDVWGGVADGRTGRPWDATTLAVGFSTSKGAVAALCCRLAQEGVVDLDEPLVRRWPELARGGGGKDRITLRTALAHMAGLPGVRRDLEPADLVAGTPVVEALAAEPPWWEPGTAAGYHAVTFGYLVGEALRRATGSSLGALLDAHVARPLGLELWIGAPDAVLDRVARLEPAPGGADDDPEASPEPPDHLFTRTFANPPMSIPAWNARPLLRAEVAAVNAVASARSWSRLYAACIGAVDGVRLLEPAWRDAGRETAWHGPDLVQPGGELHVGLGFRLATADDPGTGPGWFGHGGSGGAFALADPEAGLSVAYLPNRLAEGEGERRARDRITAALRAVLGAG